jgi:hypothetical protein
MAQRVRRYGLPAHHHSFHDHAVDRGIAPYEFRRPAQRDFDRNDYAPLFLSDDRDEPDPSEYIAPLRKRRVSISSRVLAGVCAAAAVVVLFALFSSDAMRDFVNVTTTMAGIVPAPAATAQAGSGPLAAPVGKDPARLAAPADGTPGAPNVTIANVSPTREEIKNAYQSALQGRAPVIATVEQAVAPVNAIHRLNPNEIAASLKRGDALIASGDLAAARLVLRRAADDGDAQAAITLAGTYDPTVLEKLGVHGTVPDVVMARGWYEKAKNFGAAEAAQRLEVLASKYR